MVSQTEQLIKQAYVYFQNGELDNAKNLANTLLLLNPKNFEAVHLMGAILGTTGDISAATLHFQRAVKLIPQSYTAHYNLAKCLAAVQNNKKALLHYDLAINLKSDYFEAICNRGVLYASQNNYQEAISNFDLALSIQGEYALAWANKAATLLKLKKYNDAIFNFKKALQINPNIPFLFGDYLDAKMKICDWSSFDSDVKDCFNQVINDKPVIQPFPFLALFDNPKAHLQCTKTFLKTKFNNIKQQKLTLNPSDKIKIGYYSADFHNHATTYLIAELIEAHNHDKFEIH